MKARAAVRAILALGAVALPSRGDHLRFRLPRTRQTVTLYQGGSRSEIHIRLWRRIEKALEAEAAGGGR